MPNIYKLKMKRIEYLCAKYDAEVITPRPSTFNFYEIQFSDFVSIRMNNFEFWIMNPGAESALKKVLILNKKLYKKYLNSDSSDKSLDDYICLLIDSLRENKVCSDTIFEKNKTYVVSWGMAMRQCQFDQSLYNLVKHLEYKIPGYTENCKYEVWDKDIEI